MFKKLNLSLNDADSLAKKALEIDDFDEASVALRSLKKIDKFCARDVALKILQEGVGDAFYQAFAFDIFYSISLHEALEYVKKRAASENLYILATMLTCVAEDVGLIGEQKEILDAVAVLRHALSLRSAEDINKIQEQKKFFDEAYL
jgi:hypothetical protein